MELDKTLTVIGSATATPYESLSVEAPTLILSDLAVSNISKVNYMYIEELGRYYNARLVMGNNGLYTVYGEVDPLMSFKSAILNLTCVIGSQVDEKNDDINDGSKTCQVNGFIQRIDWEYSFLGTGVNILICAGGGGAPASS
jgi:hypothetical protein